MTRCKPIACMLVIAIACGWVAQTAHAQADPDDGIQNLRRKTDFTAEEIAVIDRTVSELVDRLAGELDDPRQARRFEERLLAQYTHGENSPSFRRQMATRCAELFTKKLKDNNAALNLVLVRTLGKLDHAAVLPAIQQAASSADSLVRLSAIGVVNRLQPKIQNEDALLQTTLKWLEAAAIRETNRIVLQRIYQSFRFRNSGDAQAQTLLRILQRRVQNYTGGGIAAESAEIAAYVRLADLVGGLTDADRKQLVSLLGRFLVHYTHRYMYADLSGGTRLALHQLIYTCERLLIQITQPTFREPPITQAISSADDDRYDQIRAALRSWIGTPQDAGHLNGARWGVARGGDVSGLDFSTEVPYHPSDPAEEEEEAP